MKENLRKGERTALIAGSVTVIFAFLKGLIGFFSGSVVLMADAFHSGADSLSTFLAFLGLKISQKKPTERFPYGFYKAESIASLLISLLILLAGFSILLEGLKKIFYSYQISYPLFALGIAFVDAFCMFLVGTFELKVGREINSQSLIADGLESRMHIFSSSIVLIGLLSKIENIPYIEPLMGIFISLFVLKIGFFSVKDSIFSLLDISPSREIESKVKTILSGISGIAGFENLRLRKSGPFIFGEVYVKIREDINVKRAHEISRFIEGKIKNQIKEIDSFIVVPLPWKTGDKKICIPLDNDKGLESEISLRFGRANYFLLVDFKRGEIERWWIEKNPFKKKEIRAGLAVSNWLKERKINTVLTKEIGLISLHFLRDNLIEVYLAKEKKASEAIEAFKKGKLELLKEPTKEKI